MTSISVLAVFAQGLLSFFSPCVVPLVPLYVGYLAGGTRTVDDDGTVRYDRRTVMVNTFFFVVGVSFAFFALGLGFTAAGQFLSQNRDILARLGGIVIVLFGLVQLGILGGGGMLSEERRLPLNLDKLAMSPLVALLMGFTFSFAWTPCVGPILAGVLVLASSASSGALGFALVAVYTLGFVIPFLAVGLATGSVLDFFRRHQRGLAYTTKAAGVILVLMGVMMVTGWMNGVTGYLSQTAVAEEQPATTGSSTTTASTTATASSTATTTGSGSAAAATGAAATTGTAARQVTPAPDFTLYDQYGNVHKLSDYRGKVVFLNFWATWCTYCRAEMPSIQSLYADNGSNSGDVVVLGVANPKTSTNNNNVDGTQENVSSFLNQGGYSYPVVMDLDGSVFRAYGIASFPTTFMIDKEGNLYGYVRGAVTRATMDSMVQQTLQSTN